MQYYCAYTLGMYNPATLAATKGNVTHKVLECLAYKKLCLQRGEAGFHEESLGYLTLDDCDPDNLTRLSFNWHRENFVHNNWNDKKDFRDCRAWVQIVLDDPFYNPLLRNVIQPEQSFDFEIREPWAKYHYEFDNGTVFDGYLRLKGTMDLVTEVRPGCLEIIDWKTGASQKDFVTGKEKDFWSFHEDAQLRLYHLACHELFPNMDDITLTIYFIRVDRPNSLMLGPEDLPKTKELIRHQFEWIRRTSKPQLNPGPEWSEKPNKRSADFKCHRLCRFSKPSDFSEGKPVCQFIKEKIESEGIDKVTNKYINLDRLSTYGQGGGRGYDK